MSSALALCATAALGALATTVCARLAPRVGWTDAPRAADAARKHQRRPVPAVGGAALLLALAATPAALCAGDEGELWARWLPASGWQLATLGLVFAVGTWDDRVALGPVRKTLALTLALAPLALGTLAAHGAPAALGLCVLALFFLNVLNTFDNSDGALAGLCALGFAGAAAPVSAACLGFLPFNLDAARVRNRASGAPSAYLGDAGAFLLGYLVLVQPRAAGLCVLPLLDLARLAWVRWRAGSRPWIGDRRHLAHRLLARGLSRAGVAALECALAAPACAGTWLALARGDWRPFALGAAVTSASFALALRAAPAEPAAPPGGVACSARAGPR